MARDLANVGKTTLLVRRREGEPARRTLERLAVRAGKARVPDFLRTVPNARACLAYDLRLGRNLDVLARMTGFDRDYIERSTPVLVDENVMLGGVRLASAKVFLLRQDGRGRVCSVCLEADLDVCEGVSECRAYRRYWWDFSEFDGCPIHGVRLVTNCGSCGRHLSSTGLRADRCECGGRFAGIGTQIALGQVFEAALLDILRDRGRPTWSDELDLTRAAGLALRVGVLMEFGRHASGIDTIDAPQRAELRDRGHRTLDHPQMGFRHALDFGVDAARGALFSPHQAYGELWRWLARTSGSGLERYRVAIFDHAKEHVRPQRDIATFGGIIPASANPAARPVPLVPKGFDGRFLKASAIAGDRVDPRRRHQSVKTLASETGRTLGQIAALATSVSHRVYTASDRHAAIPKNIAARVRDILARALTADEMQKLLGLSAGRFSLFVLDNRELILPKERPSSRNLYDGAAIGQFFEALKRHCPVVRQIPDGAVPVMDVGRDGRRLARWSVTATLVRQGIIRPVGLLGGAVGLRAILVDRAEVRRQLVAASSEVPTLSCEDARARLGISSCVLASLRRAGLLEYAIRRGSKGSSVGPTIASVEAFDLNHVTAHRLLKEMNWSARRNRQDAQGLGLIDVARAAQWYDEVYRREQAVAALSRGGFAIPIYLRQSVSRNHSI